MKIHHFALYVTDLDKSVDFYVNKLGLTLKVDRRADNFVNVDLNGAEIELIKIPEDKTMHLKAELCPHLAFESDNIDNEIALCKEKGIPIFDGPLEIPNDVKMFTILDPDGYRIDFGQLL